MNRFSVVLLGAIVVAVTGCGPSPGIETAGNKVVSVEILDFNWERGVTTTYTVTSVGVKVLGGEPEPYKENVTFSSAQEKIITQKFKGIERIYDGSFTDDRVVDGVIIEFRFTLRDGSVVSTKLSNIRIDSYAELTEAVSDIVSRDIQFHQYDLTKHR